MGVSIAEAMACSACGVGAKGEGADTQDPLEAVEGTERRACGCVQSDEPRQKMQAGSLVAVWELA